MVVCPHQTHFWSTSCRKNDSNDNKY